MSGTSIEDFRDFAAVSLGATPGATPQTCQHNILKVSHGGGMHSNLGRHFKYVWSALGAMEGQRRLSARLATSESYSYDTPQVDITDITDARAVDDLRLSEALKKKKEIRDFLNAQGYDSVFRFCLEELCDTTPISKREDATLRDNISQLVGACLSHPRFKLQDVSLSEKICKAEGEVFRKEVIQLSDPET